ncbi:MAG: zf-HC2 domain-containing protein [Acidobacteriota bacterium]
MKCTQYRQWIQERSDGTLGPLRAGQVDSHLAECDACAAFAADLDAIHAAAELLAPLAPPDRVWLQIAGQLLQEGRVSPLPAARPVPGRHMALLAIAAALVLAVGASIVLLLSQAGPRVAPRPSDATVQPGNAAADETVQSVEAEFRLAEQHYQNAIGKLEQAERLDRTAAAGQQDGEDTIDPKTAAMLQKNLQVIDQAIAESRAALRSEPQSAPARDSLFDALRRKVGLLQDTIALMNEMRKGNSAGAAQIVDGVNKS